MILLFVIKAAYLCLPAYLANMAPVIIDKLGWFKPLARPIDFGRQFKNRPLLGKGKTWRGLLSGILVAIIVAAIQKLLFQYETVQSISLVNFDETSFLLYGFLAGSGALIGDMVKSFFKRRINIASGKSWPIADQLDFIAGFFIFTYWLIRPEWIIVITAFLITLILHPLTNIIGYLLKIKKVWW
jgi:CDP-2,3-bis-(O-geranylgeranyl)-sn-glycerol synthase